MRLLLWRLRASSALHSRDWRILFYAGAARQLGNWAFYLAETWFLYRLHPSPWVLGLVSVASLGPFLVLPALGGRWADRYGVRIVAQSCKATALGCTALYMLLYVLGHANPWTYLALSLVMGCCRALESPAVSVTQRNCLSRTEQLASGVALYSALYSVARIVGPVVASGLIVAFSELAAFALAALTQLPDLWLYARLQLGSAAPAAKAMGWRAALATLHDPGVRSAAYCLALANLCVIPCISQLTALAVDVLHGSVATSTALMATVAPLGVLASLYAARLCAHYGSQVVLRVAVIATAMVLAGLGEAQSLPGMLVLVALLGGSQALLSVTATSRLSEALGLNVKAHTAGLLSIFATGAGALGALLVGMAGSFVGVSNAFLGCAAALLVLGLTSLRPRHPRPTPP